jgi:hypothetical protein
MVWNFDMQIFAQLLFETPGTLAKVFFVNHILRIGLASNLPLEI